MTYSDDDENEIEDLRFALEHKKAEALELRAIIRRLTDHTDPSLSVGTDPMDGTPCPHLVRPGESVCVICGETVPVP